jgi:inosine-uridine nucleoside N-ribohydrolase
MGLTFYCIFTGIYLHDPTCMAALLDPTLFTFKKGAVRVETEGLCVGHTLLDMGLKKYVLCTRPMHLLFNLSVNYVCYQHSFSNYLKIN